MPRADLPDELRDCLRAAHRIGYLLIGHTEQVHRRRVGDSADQVERVSGRERDAVRWLYERGWLIPLDYEPVRTDDGALTRGVALGTNPGPRFRPFVTWVPRGRVTR